MGGEMEEVRRRSPVAARPSGCGITPVARGWCPGPGFRPKSSSSREHSCPARHRAHGRCIRGRGLSVLAGNPCCFRPCRVSDHYILAFNSLLLFIDFDNYSGLRKKKRKKKYNKPPTAQFLQPTGGDMLVHPLPAGGLRALGWFI